MDSISIFTTALEFERKIRDLYEEAVAIVDDDRGKSIFSILAKDEQSHIDFLEHSIDILRNKGEIDQNQLKSSIPDTGVIRLNIDRMKTKIPEKMLGNVKRVLSSALQLEEETTQFYTDAYAKTEGNIKSVLGKFVEIEQRHTEVVQIELDYASRDGFWFDFMEKDMEEGWSE